MALISQKNPQFFISNVYFISKDNVDKKSKLSMIKTIFYFFDIKKMLC